MLEFSEKRKQENKTTIVQEKQFNSNKFRFSKQCVNGTLGKDNIQPSYDKTTADQFYASTYSEPKDLDFNNCGWFPNFATSPADANFSPFDNSPFKPRDVKRVLAKSNKKSAPGPDGIAYSVLFKLESIHHILATYYNKVYTHGSPPSSWGICD